MFVTVRKSLVDISEPNLMRILDYGNLEEEVENNRSEKYKILIYPNFKKS